MEGLVFENTPVLIQKGTPTDTPGSPGNPAKHTQFRSLIFEAVDGATGYNVYAYATLEDANSDRNRVAVAENVAPTIESVSTGGTMGQIPMDLVGNEVLIDVRLIQFKTLIPGATRDLPASYTPAGLGDTYCPGDGSGDKTNLRPGQYWFRIQAVAGDATSSLCDFYADGDAFSIAMGPDEARETIEATLHAKGTPGTTADSAFRIVDVRAFPEFGDEGYIRFSERIMCGDFNTVEKAEALFGHLDNKSTVTIFVYCRGGGRSATAARHLSNAGYTNVLNIQGVIQWTQGLCYDDAEFRFRQVTEDVVDALSEDIDGALAAPTDEDSPSGITYDTANNALRWYNIPRAKYNIYAFDSAAETDTAKAVATKTLDALGQDLTGTGADWRFVRKLDIAALGLPGGTYYLRVQALPEAELPASEKSTLWGAPSRLSDAVTVN